MTGKEVNQLEEKQRIIDLTIAYTWIIDHGPRENLQEVFTEDAVFIIDTRYLNGIDEIRGKIVRTLGGLSASQHIVSNHQVSIDGNTATSRCYLHAQHTMNGTEGGDNYVMAGRYIDKLIRSGDEWRINKRQLILDWTEGNPKVLGFR